MFRQVHCPFSRHVVGNSTATFMRGEPLVILLFLGLQIQFLSLSQRVSRGSSVRFFVQRLIGESEFGLLHEKSSRPSVASNIQSHWLVAQKYSVLFPCVRPFRADQRCSNPLSPGSSRPAKLASRTGFGRLAEKRGPVHNDKQLRACGKRKYQH
ncbi:hypothetical protein BJY00DRAFT_111004 [Aspergillus carlsbadensis]|nr:hypothetical protein BJY00DRAFT_111004 [Aspergillus carlsbadensis]